MDGFPQTSSGIPLQPVYGPADRREDPPAPGCFPFTRGNYATGYRGRLWTFRQYSGFGTAEESNGRYRYLLDQGGTGPVGRAGPAHPVRLRLRRPRRRARRSAGSASRSTPWPTPRSCSIGIPLDQISTSFTINGTAAILLAFYVAAAERAGVPRAKLTRDDPERHPQGVRLPRHLDLAAAAVAAADRGHHRVLRSAGAAVQRDLGGRRPLPRRRRQRRAGDGVHPGRRGHLLRRPCSPGAG